MTSSGRRASSAVEAVVWGIGSELRGDDGIGVWVARAMARLLRGREEVLVRACGISPENYAPEVVRLRPKVLLVVDAAEMGLEPGRTRILDLSLLADEEMLLFHGLPTVRVLRWVLPSVGRLLILGVQPGEVGLGLGFSEGVLRSRRAILEEALSVLGDLLRPGCAG